MAVGIPAVRDGKVTEFDADMMVVNVVDGVATAVDYKYGSQRGDLQLDTALGGVNDLIVVSGSENGSGTEVRWRRKIATGDANDFDITMGPTTLLVAIGATDDVMEGYHGADKAVISVTVLPVPPPPPTPSASPSVPPTPVPTPPTPPTPTPIINPKMEHVIYQHAVCLGTANCLSGTDKGMLVRWSVGANEVSFQVEAVTPGYIGFGFAADQTAMMKGGNAVIGFINDSGVPFINEFNMSGYDVTDVNVVPQPDRLSGKQIQYDGATGILKMRWTRPILGANGVSLFQNGMCEIDSCTVIYAIGALPKLGNHLRAEGAKLNLMKGVGVTQQQLSAYRFYHAMCMFLAWGILLPVGVLIPRYFKSLGTVWFLLHRIIQCAGAFFAVVGFGFSFVLTGDLGKEHFTSAPHQMVGFVILSMLFAQLSMSFFRAAPGTRGRKQWLFYHQVRRLVANACSH
jgi:hypothetical protein